MGLNITVLSYEDRLDFAIVADREQVPDAWPLMDALGAGARRAAGMRVLIVGAGFGGIAAAIELQRHGFARHHDPRRGAGARRHLAPQQLPGRGLRRAEPPLLVLLRAAPRLVAAVLAAAGDPRLPARASRATSASTGWIVAGTRRHLLRVGRRRRAAGRVDDRRRAHASRPTRSSLATGQLHQPRLPAHRGPRGVRRATASTRPSGTTTTTCAASASRSIGTGASAVQFVPEIAEQAGAARRSSSARATGSCRARNRAYPRWRASAVSSTSPACRPSGGGSCSTTASR